MIMAFSINTYVTMHGRGSIIVYRNNSKHLIKINI